MSIELWSTTGITRITSKIKSFFGCWSERHIAMVHGNGSVFIWDDGVHSCKGIKEIHCELGVTFHDSQQTKAAQLFAI